MRKVMDYEHGFFGLPMAGRPASPKAFSGSGSHSSRGYTKRERAGARRSLRRGSREESS